MKKTTEQARARPSENADTSRLTLYHEAFRQCFPDNPEAYTLTITHGVAGALVVRKGRHYRVETFADRLQICEQQLTCLDEAREVPYFVAERVLEGVNEHDEFYVQLMQVFYSELEHGPAPVRGQRQSLVSSALERKINLALALGIQAQTGQLLWRVFSSVEDDLVAASLVAARRLDTGEFLAQEMAEVYFELGASELIEVQGGYFAQVDSGDTELIVYEVDPS